MSILGDIKRLIIEINGFPIGRKLSSYILLLVAFALAVFSVWFCALMTWGMIEGLLDGSFSPNITPDESEWDIR